MTNSEHAINWRLIKRENIHEKMIFFAMSTYLGLYLQKTKFKKNKKTKQSKPPPNTIISTFLHHQKKNM